MKFSFLPLVFLAFTTASLAQSNTVPLLNQPLVPASAAPGSGKFTLTINGTGFVSGAVVNWNGVPHLTEVVSNSQVQATINASDVAKAKTASVTVVNPTPGGGTSNVVYFPVRKSAPSVILGRIDKEGAYPWGFVVGDLNNDGKLDVAAGKKTTSGAGDIQLFLGNGNGTFKAPIESASKPPYGPRYMADFNNDGKLDLLAVGPHLNVTTFLGNGNGKFVQEKGFNACGICNAAVFTSVADFNGDGNLDLVIIAPDDRDGVAVVSVFLGDGNGEFGGGWTSQTINDGRGIAAIGDFNGDGKLDFAAPDGNAVDIFIGNGDGTFQNPVAYETTYSAGVAVVAADVNGDGKLDLITGGGSVLLGNGDGTFRANGGISTGFSFYNLFVGDFNGDGILDLVGLDNAGNVDIFLGNGDGTFQNALVFPGGSPNSDQEYPILGIGDFNGDGNLDVVSSGSVNGNGVLSVFLQNGFSLSPRNLAFGNQEVKTKSQPQSVTLTNLGSSPLPISGITIVGADPKDFAQTNNCGKSLPANSSCQIQVTFTPLKVASFSASVNVSYQGAGSPQTALLTGTGVSPADPTVSLTPPNMTFSTQLINTTSATQTATLMNTGNETVSISSISAMPPFSETNNCPSTFNVGATCQIKVTFTPTAPGVLQGTLSVTDNALNSPQTVGLTGTGTVVMLSPISVNFGDQQVNTTSNPATITLTNEWTSPLSISQIQIAGTDPEDFSIQSNSCGSSVPAGGFCTIMVTFTPTLKGQRSAQFSVSDNGGGSPQTIPLTGTGT